MKPFMDQDFLLENDVAKKLYHEYAENMPIYDYHCHISPRMIYENYQFQNIGELMLGGDHYKWRVMLSNGVDEKFIRGDASWHDKWLAFAASLKYCIGNPMFHWTHLELRRVFGIEEILSEKTAEDIWNRANALLATEEYRCRGLIEKFGVKVICTTDDPVDDLEHQIKIAQDPTCKFKVYPAWRPDKVLNIERGGFVDYMNRLSRVSGIHCLNLESMMQALESRLDFFHAHGARLSDHALDTVPYGVPSTHIAGEAFRKAMSGAPLTEAERGAIDGAIAALRSVDLIPCTNCGYCVKDCPEGVKIPIAMNLLNLEKTCEDNEFVKGLYSWQAAEGPASKCIQCGTCEAMCPQSIGIIDHLAEAVEHFEG